ncbi:hypothetical protein AHiyo4_38260 [Arthrobacter sp. Hiyo4]|nr:hypothetical protein AHiyo4_38260 [Arthrobacter sp. Hiyo4]
MTWDTYNPTIHAYESRHHPSQRPTMNHATRATARARSHRPPHMCIAPTFPNA